MTTTTMMITALGGGYKSNDESLLITLSDKMNKYDPELRNNSWTRLLKEE